MYVFISYSSLDQEFARRLSDSLTLHGIPIFLDERKIRVGDSIPDQIYSALDRASHVICVVSAHSAHSRWVKEELSVAKMKELSGKGCSMIPVLIEAVDLPISIQHLKYADFRHLSEPSAYLVGLRGVLTALGLELDSGISLEETDLIRFHLPNLIRMKGFGDSMSQLYFQMERLWFYLWERDPRDVHMWFGESVDKTCDLIAYKESLFAFDQALLRVRTKRIRAVANYGWETLGDYQYFESAKFATHDEVYRRFWTAEEHARSLSAGAFGLVLLGRPSPKGGM